LIPRVTVKKDIITIFTSRPAGMICNLKKALFRRFFGV